MLIFISTNTGARLQLMGLVFLILKNWLLQLLPPAPSLAGKNEMYENLRDL